ncbi:MAG TPA: hypothetical protein VFV58_39230 [Blastocatellia bacterium]|jgi:hypothetical protein|nr:hypothetical protein [Blastocatellia bacterium]
MARSWIYEKGSPTGGSSSGAAQTPWLSDIDGNQHNLHNASLVSVAEDFTAADKKQSSALFPDKLVFYNDNTSRWAFAEEGAETGSNVGSDLHLFAYDDTGAFLRTQMSFIRSTGETILNADQGAEINTQAGYGIEFTTDYLALPTSTAYNSLRIPQGGIDCAGIYLSSHATPYWGGYIDFPSLAGALNFPVALAGHAFTGTDVLLWASTSNGTISQIIGQHLCCNAWIDAAAGFVTAQGYHMLSHSDPATLNGPVSAYGAIAHKAGSTYWYFDPTVPQWKEIDFSAVAGGTAPGGVTQSVQYKDAAGHFGGDGNIKWDYTQQILNIIGKPNQQGIYVSNAYVVADGGFQTASTADNAIQAPSGGGLFRKVRITSNVTSFADVTAITLFNSANISNATGGVLIPNWNEVYVNNSSLANTCYANFYQLVTTGTTASPSVYVFISRPYVQSSGTIGYLVAYNAGPYVYTAGATGTINNVMGFWCDGGAYGGGATSTIGNWFCFIGSNPAATTITNLYGVRMEALSSGQHNYAIFTQQSSTANDSWAMYNTGDAPSYFGGKVGIKTAPTWPLQVMGVSGSPSIYASIGYIHSEDGFYTPAPSYQAIQATTGGVYCNGVGIISSSISPYKGGYIDLPRLQGGINFPQPLLNASFPDGWTDVLLWASSANQPPAAKVVLTTHLCCNAWINAASGFVTAQNVHMKAHASTADLNPPGGGYGVFAFQGNSTYYYWDDTPSPTLPAGWKTLNFNTLASIGGAGTDQAIQYYKTGTGITGEAGFAWDYTNKILSLNPGILRIASDVTNQISMTYANDTSYFYPYIAFSRHRGTLAAPTKIQSGDILGGVNWYGSGNGGAAILCTAVTVSASPNYYVTGALSFLVGDGSGGGSNATSLELRSTYARFYESVGIGDAPWNTLSVRGDIGAYATANTSSSAKIAASIYLGDPIYYNASYYAAAPGLSAIWETASGQTSGLAFYTYAGGTTRTERMRIQYNGYVGINNPAPQTFLHVKGTSNSVVGIECEQGFIQSNGGLYVDVATNYNSIQTVGGIVALGRIGVFPAFTPDLGSGLTGVTGLFVTSNATNNLLVDCYDSANDPTRVPGFIGRRAYYTGGLPGSGVFQNLPSGLTLMSIGGRGAHSGGFISAASASITFVTSEAWSGSAWGTDIQFNVTPNTQSSRYAKMWLHNTGQLHVRGQVTGENPNPPNDDQTNARSVGVYLENGNFRAADSHGGAAFMMTSTGGFGSANLPIPGTGVGGLAYQSGSTYYYYTGTGWGTVNFATTGAGVTSVNGMSGPAISIAGSTGVTASNGSNTVTLSIGQPVGTTNDVTFRSVQCSGAPGTGIIFQYSGGSNFQVDNLGNVSCMQININGILSADSGGKWLRTVQTNNHVYGGDFGIIGGGVTSYGNHTGLTVASGAVVALKINNADVNVRIIGGIICYETEP